MQVSSLDQVSPLSAQLGETADKFAVGDRDGRHGEAALQRRNLAPARVSALLLALVVVTLAPAPLHAQGAALATWNLPFPRTLSYRVLGQDPKIKCGLSDASFKRRVTDEGLDKYEIDLVTGHRLDCGRLKAEQFKRIFPKKMVVLYENPGGDSPLAWPGGTWAGYYLMMNRTKAAAAVSSTQTAITVADPRVFSVGDTAVMWLATGSDPYANSEWVKIRGISGSTLTVTRDMFATGVHSYAQAPSIAATATGPSYPNPDFNLSDVAPVNPANGERANQWMARNIVGDFAPSTAGQPTLDAVEFDTASWVAPANNTNGAIKNLDCNGDGVIDYCNRNDGTSSQVNSYGIGYDAFVQAVKQGLAVYDVDPNRPPKMVLADGELGLRSLATANGVEFESYPTWDNYTYSSPALETLGVWQTQDTATGPHLSYAFTKDITPLYAEVSSHNPNGCVTPAQGGTCRNGELRYGMVSALLWGAGSAYNDEAGFTHPLRWDEEATINEATTGLAPGYLGQPVGAANRVTRFSTGNLDVNPSFEQDLNSATATSVLAGVFGLARDTTTAAPGWGTASLRADVTGLTADPQVTDDHASTDISGPVAPGEYTVDFWAKALNKTAGPQATNLGVSLDGVIGAPQVVLLTNTWTHYYLQLEATTSAPKATVRFYFGSQIGSTWLDGIRVHRGTAGILTREFTHGIVVLNDSFSTQTNVALADGPYHHINGAQDRSVNNGAEVGSTLPTLAGKDGVILLRG